MIYETAFSSSPFCRSIDVRLSLEGKLNATCVLLMCCSLKKTETQ